MGGGDGEVEDWPLLSAVKARGGKKRVGERKKEKERKSQPHGLRFPTEVHLTAVTPGDGALTAPPVPPASSVSRRQGRPLAGRASPGAEGADLGRRAPQRRCLSRQLR